MIEKQTDFRKGMDFIRTVRKAKLREFLTPFAKYCKAENIVPLVEHFLPWKEHFVEDETYLAQFNPWNAASFWTLKNRVCHIWQKTLTGSREMKNIVLGDESPMTLSEMP